MSAHVQVVLGEQRQRLRGLEERGTVWKGRARDASCCALADLGQLCYTLEKADWNNSLGGSCSTCFPFCKCCLFLKHMHPPVLPSSFDRALMAFIARACFLIGLFPHFQPAIYLCWPCIWERLAEWLLHGYPPSQWKSLKPRPPKSPTPSPAHSNIGRRNRL